MKRFYWPLIAFFLGSCGGRTITPSAIIPPAIPGLVTIPEAISCAALVADEDAVWAALGDFSVFSNEKDELVRIDLDSNQSSVRVRNLPYNKIPFGLIGPDIELGSRALWVAKSLGGKDESIVWKVDSKSGEIVGELRPTKLSSTAASFTLMRVALGEHAVWVTSYDNRTLLRFDPETAELSSSIELHTAALDVAVTDGAVWVLHPDATLSRIDPSTNRVLGAIRLPDTYSTLTASSDVIWLATPSSPFPWFFAQESSPVRSGAELARLDPRENKIVERIRLGEDFGRVDVSDIVVGEHTVWVSLIVGPQEESQDSGGRLWIAEIDSTTNEVSRMIPLGEIHSFHARIALAENDLLVCASSIWRIPLDALRAASLPPQSGPAQ